MGDARDGTAGEAGTWLWRVQEDPEGWCSMWGLCPVTSCCWEWLLQDTTLREARVKGSRDLCIISSTSL